MNEIYINFLSFQINVCDCLNIINEYKHKVCRFQHRDVISKVSKAQNKPTLFKRENHICAARSSLNSTVDDMPAEKKHRRGQFICNNTR